jgi:predicted dehydrogenase
MRVKIYGAGSIGNHLANAARVCGWSVDIVDIDRYALERTRTQIYPNRYGSWDSQIGLFEAKDDPPGGYDLICIGTPPDSHISLALKSVSSRPRAILVEKPFCSPDLTDIPRLLDDATKNGVEIFVGYDHAVGEASERLGCWLDEGLIGTIETLDVEFREFWGGIFAAHPWLSGPEESYLGYWKRGGGATGEHSHAINLWQHYAHKIGAGRVVEVSASMAFVQNRVVDYDKISSITLRTESGLLGRVIQDVITSPPRKWVRLQGSDGAMEWHGNFRANSDAIYLSRKDGQRREYMCTKTRPDDFIKELRHIEQCLNLTGPVKSPISVDRGLDTMLVIAAAYKSAQTGRVVGIDYSQGYTSEALN